MLLFPLEAGCSAPDPWADVMKWANMALDSVPAQQDIKKSLIQHCGSYCTVCVGHLPDSFCRPRHPPSVACSLHLSPFSAHQPMTHYSSRVCVCVYMCAQCYQRTEPLPSRLTFWMDSLGSEASLEPYMLTEYTRNWYFWPSCKSKTG